LPPSRHHNRGCFRLEDAVSLAALVPLDHVQEPLVQADRLPEGGNLGLELGEVGLLAGAAFLLGAIEGHLDLDAGEVRNPLHQVDQLDRCAAREVDRVAVDGALDGEAEPEREIARMQEVPHLAAGSPHHHRPIVVQDLLHQRRNDVRCLPLPAVAAAVGVERPNERDGKSVLLEHVA
jgi:hypothetical protein